MTTALLILLMALAALTVLQYLEVRR